MPYVMASIDGSRVIDREALLKLCKEDLPREVARLLQDDKDPKTHLTAKQVVVKTSMVGPLDFQDLVIDVIIFANHYETRAKLVPQAEKALDELVKQVHPKSEAWVRLLGPE